MNIKEILDNKILDWLALVICGVILVVASVFIVYWYSDCLFPSSSSTQGPSTKEFTESNNDKDDENAESTDNEEPNTQDTDLIDNDRSDDTPSPENPCLDPLTKAPISTPTRSEFVLTNPALVFNTAQDAKDQNNPVKTYETGTYSIYKCYDGMANITRTSGSPGGWINPDNLSGYDTNTNPNTPPPQPDPPTVDVMTLNNDRVGWSYAYPSSFVTAYNGYWNFSDNNLYLTFDCGYDYNNLVSTILTILNDNNVKAVFFVTGSFMNSRPDLIQRMVSEGHIVGNHSLNHINQPANLNESTSVVVADIQGWETTYKSIMGTLPAKKFFRPPEGVISVRSVALMNQLGYRTLLWGAAYRDWDPANQSTAEEAMNALRTYTSAGDVILLHGTSQTNVDILDQYIDEYRGKGFEFRIAP